jgi:hypothetical protein
MSQTKSGSWKKERASVTVQGKARPRSNKYSAADSHQKPAPGTRQKTWVGAYEKSDGTHVAGYYRGIGQTKNGTSR